jgi:TRAP-type mannitol/chloroaromatic compound transport system substrate-binding protein
MKKMSFFLTLFFVGILTFFGTGKAEAKKAEKTVLLKVPSCFPFVLPGMGTNIVWLADHIEEVSGGTIRMKIYEPGKLVPPMEILESVSQGRVEAGYSVSGYWQGKMSAAPLFSSVPFGPEAGEYFAWFYHGNGMKLYQEMYDQAGYNVKVLLCGLLAPESSGWFRIKVEKPEDLKGLRMRFFGLGGEVMERLGVSVSLLPPGEIFQSLERKAIDATEFSMPAIDQKLGFYKVCEYNYWPGWHQQATTMELLINKDIWKSLSPHQKAVLEMMARATTLESFAYNESLQGKVIRENVEKRGVKNMEWSAEMLELYKKTWLEVVNKKRKEDPFFNRVWEDLSDFRQNYDYWENVAFLPRK